MEKRIISKVQTFNNGVKSNVLEWLASNNATIQNSDGVDITEDFRAFVANYEDITFRKEDFLKRKRVKNMAPQHERCCAKRADGSQCTRRKREDSMYCGTHIKGTPHGLMSYDAPKQTTKEVEVFLQEIKGIGYWIDNNNNVYKGDDILSGKQDPSIIATYELVDGEYKIPEFEI